VIINLRGTSGSGKSYVVKEFLDTYTSEEVLENKKIVGYYLDTEFGKLFVVGKYTNVCGGCDTLSVEHSRKLIKKHGRLSSVLFEGLIMNKGYTINRDIIKKLSGEEYTFAFLDTTLQKCLSRVRKRRKEKGNLKILNPYHTKDSYYRNLRILERCVQDKAHPVVIDHANAFKEVLSVFKGEF